MMRGTAPSKRLAAAVIGFFAVSAATICASPATAAGSYSPYAESATAALGRYVRTLTSSPRDFGTLINAGRAALALGDTQAAAGFFARADEVNPRSPLPQVGMGAVSVANGEAQAALPYFTRAQQLGAPLATICADRGLAYDLLGKQAQAQADYRTAFGGLDSDEARRRLALSLAISGNRAEALTTLAPLAAKGDAAAYRTRAFVLALSGDTNGAMAALEAALPGSRANMAPFLQRLPALQAGQKAAAVNLGIFPDSGATAYAYSAPAYAAPQTTTLASSANVSRLSGIDELLSAPATPPVTPPQPQPSWVPRPSSRMTSVAAAANRQQAADRPPKIWLQLASGSNPDALPRQFQSIRSKGRDLMDGIRGYVAKGPDRARLVIGPFKNNADAETFAEGLDSVNVNSFRWTNSAADTIVPLGTE